VNELVHTIRVEHLNVREIIAWIFENNFPSISVVNRNDFTACRETREGNLLGTPTTMRKFSKELERVTIIGEAGVNHNGDINIARKLIEVASTSGLDFVKFQTWMTDELVDKSAPKANYQKKNDSSSSQYQMLKKLELQFSEFCELKKYAESLGISFLSTPDDKPSLDFLTDELDLRIVKIGSGELTNIPFLRQIGRKQRPVILSTGMGNLGEVERAYDTLLSSGSPSVSLLHCTSNYPAPMVSANLKAMLLLKNAFGCTIGYSDHTEGLEVSIAAVALGAQIIEKHFTLDRNLPGPDHIASVEPVELKKLVSSIRNVELAISGSGQKRPYATEIEIKKVVSKGVYARKHIHCGDLITEDILQFKRPATAIGLSNVDLIIGRPAKREITSGRALTLGDVAFE